MTRETLDTRRACTALAALAAALLMASCGPADTTEGSGTAPRSSSAVGTDVTTHLSVSHLDQVVTAPQTTATLDDVTGVAAPRGTDRIVGHDAPGGRPLLALDWLTLEQPAAWTVVAQDDAWVQVLVPLGRGALASQAPIDVNSRAVWVLRDQVDIAPVEASLMVDRATRTATVRYTDGTERVIQVGVGADTTPTPAGLGMISAHVDTDYGIAAATSFQSDAIDTFLGAAPVIALHLDPQQGASIGHARSNGCIRMGTQADVDTILALPLGTPILIK